MSAAASPIRSVFSLASALLAVWLSAPAQADLLIEHVSVISMLPGQKVLPDMNVLIKGQRIQSITPASAPPPDSSEAQRIDGRGQWLMPGLADMHVHLESDRLFRLYTGDSSIPNGTASITSTNRSVTGSRPAGRRAAGST